MAARVTVYSGRARSRAFRISRVGRIDIAKQAAQEARASAPVVTGDYRDGIAVVVDDNRVYLVDDDPDAVFKEYGTSDTPAHAALTDAARKHGKYRGWRPH
ncbi:HK97 gp10 family phage protein [Rhodococcus sp. HM1]|uniref:HK97 gp10 family phage protein n=1 Tax=Rhodococcus sp. HM1 TaxID=2937759 RepID=UPI00200B481B|nr:HK97 gp10 family phage protein [Rhodococcus sp. HM1]MCK8671004.1 HK97 gp10 family phage protein [Rhodococcus sp. HM1]